MKGFDEEGGAALLQRVGGRCEPAAAIPTAYPFRAGVQKALAQVEPPVMPRQCKGACRSSERGTPSGVQFEWYRGSKARLKIILWFWGFFYAPTNNGGIPPWP